MKILLPATINPPVLHKDGSARISFDTRELAPEEVMVMMSMRNSEGWVCYSANKDDMQIPEENAEVDEKSASERLRNVLFVFYKKQVEAGKFVGLFETFRKQWMEKIIDGVKKKLD